VGLVIEANHGRPAKRYPPKNFSSG